MNIFLPKWLLRGFLVSGEETLPNLNTTTAGNLAFGYPGIVGAMMNTRFGEPFGESFEGMS